MLLLELEQAAAKTLIARKCLEEKGFYIMRMRHEIYLIKDFHRKKPSITELVHFSFSRMAFQRKKNQFVVLHSFIETLDSCAEQLHLFMQE